jgi:hypothetical protein
MAHKRALEVMVQGELPEEMLQKISHAVQNAVRDELARVAQRHNTR